MYWVVQENIRDEASYDEFITALGELNIEHCVVKVVPFSHDIIPDVNPTGQVMVWGSTTLDLVAKHKGWTPGTFLNDNYDQRIWTRKYVGCKTCEWTGIEHSGVCHCGDDYENHSQYDNHGPVEMTRICEDCDGRSHVLNDDAEFYEFGQIPKYDGQRFLRPVHDMKVFAGSIVEGNELEGWKEAIQRYSDGYTTLRPDTIVSVSSLKEIKTETRFFVVGGRVVTGSLYRIDGQPHYERRTEDWRGDWMFAQQMVDIWQPADAFVLDVAFTCTESGDQAAFKVIEVNCINSAGFYNADMRAVVAAIEEL